MTDKEIFKKAIEKAEKVGFKSHLELLPELPQNSTCALELKYKLLWEKRYEVIFSHNFAKAFWGDKLVNSIGSYCDNLCEDSQLSWKYHLQTMVLYTFPLEHLRKFL